MASGGSTPEVALCEDSPVVHTSTEEKKQESTYVLHSGALLLGEEEDVKPAGNVPGGGSGEQLATEGQTSDVGGIPALLQPFQTREEWDPLKKPTRSSANTWCVKRIKRDLRTVLADPLPGIFVHVDESDITVMHALVSGPFDTPYEGGFFYFYMRFPEDYPNVPPKVRLMTTGGGQVRFNPNLYQSGKVCLSILGTWDGPSWSPSQTLSTVLLSIQSLMSSAPYHQEPGFETERFPGDSKRYNDCIEYETLRVAVCGMVEGQVPLPAPLTHVMRLTFEPLRGLYSDRIKALSSKDGQQLNDPFNQNTGTFCYKQLLQRIDAICPYQPLA